MAALATGLDKEKGPYTTGTMPENTIVAVTHAGHHHGDEVLAAWFLGQIHGPALNIIRTTDPGTMEAADILFDCGGVYDPTRGRFDHHSGAQIPEPPDGRLCGYATAGLVWREFGPRIVKSYMLQHDGVSWEMQRKACTAEELDQILLAIVWRMDRELVAPIDAWDRGMRPDRRLVGAFLPMQWVLSRLTFEAAVAAMGDVFQFRMREVVNGEGDSWKIKYDLFENGETEFYDTPLGILVAAGGNNRVDVAAANQAIHTLLNLPCYGVVSPLRKGSRWGLFLTNPLPPRVSIPQGIDHLANRRCFYHHRREALIELAMASAQSHLDSGA
jgi:hypothetical protein